MKSFLFLILYVLFSLNCYSQYDINSRNKIDAKWKLRLYLSHSFTTYYNTDIKFSSSRYNVEIKDYQWIERGSREFFQYKKWTEQRNNPLQMIDEPSNTFVLSIEKNSHEIFLSVFHPKFLQNPEQIVYMKGTIDGVEVDGINNINRPFDGYNQFPGEMELVRNENTHREMLFEIGYGYRFKLLDAKIGNITYVPSMGLGLSCGQNLIVVVKEDDWWNYDKYRQKSEIQGFGGSLTNRIEFNTKKERFGIFYENKLSYYKQNHGFMDGNQKYNLKLIGNSVGIKFMIYNSKRSSIQQQD
jgi:hypothetical protein